MIVNARYAEPCSDCGAQSNEPCEETCLSRLATAPPAVPQPRAAPTDWHPVRGDVVVIGDMWTAATPDHTLPTTWSVWRGEREGLSASEAAIVSLIVAGLSNQEIAGALSLSMYSVKTTIRSAYRTMGVTSRIQAILWGVNHGFQLAASAARPNDGGQQ